MTKRRLIFALFTCLAFTQVHADKSAGNAVDDTWLHTKVKSSMLGHGGGGVNIEVYKGRVQLAGFVDSQSRKDKLLEKVRGVENITEVLDQLVVADPDRSAGVTLDDSTLSGAVKSTLVDSVGTGINVDVNRGRVLLSGFADDAEQRDAAVKAVSGMDKVADVINGINLKTGG